MNLLDIAEEMQLSQNKCKLLNDCIENERRAAQPEGLDKLQLEWADEMTRLHDLIEAFKDEKCG